MRILRRTDRANEVGVTKYGNTREIAGSTNALADAGISILAGKLVSITAGGRPNATVAGDRNGNGNTYNDRLPGNSRNEFTGSNYLTTDFRLTRNLKFSLVSAGSSSLWRSHST
jgi:hypothetical protein